MPDPFAFLPSRVEGDALDVAPLIRHRLTRGGTQVLMVFEGQPHTCDDMAVMVSACCAALEKRGLRRGDRVAVMLGNSPEHVALVYALIMSGLIWIPINTKLRADSLSYILDHAKPALLVTEEAFSSALLPHTVPGAEVRELFGVIGTGLPALALSHAETLCIIYTSGTTGAPKGVLFTHRMMRVAAESVLLVAGIEAGNKVFLWEPLCHIGGAQMLLVPFLVPATIFLVERFSASRFWSQWTASGATHLHYLGGILDILSRLPPEAQPAGASVRVAWGAGIAASSWDAIRTRLGCELRECYGMTECSSFATFNASGKPGSIGRPLPWFTLELLGEDGTPAPPGSTGEIVLSSQLEGVFLAGYLDNPEATARTLRGGRLHTGDMAWQDVDGDYVFVGRRVDAMRVRGENVSAWEVERVFANHPAVEASAAIGVKSDIGEQDILLHVQFKPGASVDWPELAAWSAERLASFQQPRFFRAIDQFPLTPSQRIRKHLLPRDLDGAWDRLQSSGGL